MNRPKGLDRNRLAKPVGSVHRACAASPPRPSSAPSVMSAAGISAGISALTGDDERELRRLGGDGQNMSSIEGERAVPSPRSSCSSCSSACGDSVLYARVTPSLALE